MKYVKRTRPLLAIGFLILLTSSLSFAQRPPVQPPPPMVGEDLWRQGLKPLAIEKISPGVFGLGDIRIHKKTKSVIFPAQVNMDKGLLEYLLVRSSGKVHESLLRTNIDPYNLQIAFLLLGFEGTDQPIPDQGASVKPKGEPVEILIDFVKKEGAASTATNQKIRAEEWVAKKTNGNLKDSGILDWVYTGSMVMQGQFLAQSGGSIVAIYRDPGALIDNASTGGDDDEIWFVKEGAVPPAGTSVTVTIRPRK